MVSMFSTFILKCVSGLRRNDGSDLKTFLGALGSVAPSSQCWSFCRVLIWFHHSIESWFICLVFSLLSKLHCGVGGIEYGALWGIFVLWVAPRNTLFLDEGKLAEMNIFVEKRVAPPRILAPFVQIWTCLYVQLRTGSGLHLTLTPLFGQNL